jgi:DNA-binding response OmpR family regulator
MANGAFHVLVVEDDPADVARVRDLLSEADLGETRLTQVVRLMDAREKLQLGGVDLIFLDLWLPDSFGLETFEALHRTAPDVPILVLTGVHDEAVALRAIEQGAKGFLVKGQWDGGLLAHSIRFGLGRRPGLCEFFRSVLS